MATVESLQADLTALTLRVAALETAVASLVSVNAGQDTTIRQSVLKIEQLINALAKRINDLQTALTTHITTS